MYRVWFHGQGRRPRRPRLLYAGSDRNTAYGVFGTARVRMERGRVALSGNGREIRAERRGAR